MQLVVEAKKLVDYINSLGLEIPEREPSHQHVGAIITDAVLQVGHRYKTHVKPRVQRLIEKYPEAATILGFLRSLETVGAQELLDGWKGQQEHKRLYDHAKFFAGKGIGTFDELAVWLQDEENRDSLIKAGLEIRDKTADYYRVLVRLPDAVKVDSRVEEFLTNAGIDVTKYAYKDLRSIVQIAARQLGKRPIDLDSAIWNYQERQKENEENGESTSKEETKMNKKHMKKAGGLKRKWIRNARSYCTSHNLTKEYDVIADMDWPATWHLKKGGPNGEPHWWFMRAIAGMFILMWDQKSKSEWPKPTRTPRTLKNAAYAYLGTQEGKDWQNKHNPLWVLETSVTQPQKTTPITISLLPEQLAQLKKLAGGWSIDEATLARIWILEHLR